MDISVFLQKNDRLLSLNLYFSGTEIAIQFYIVQEHSLLLKRGYDEKRKRIDVVPPGLLTPAPALSVPEVWLRLRVVRMVTPLVPRHGGT